MREIHNKRSLSIFILLIAMVFIRGQAHAVGAPVWSTDPTVNNVISTAGNDQFSPVMASDGSGGGIIAWRDYRSNSNWDIYAQRIDSTGAVKWTANGVVICNAGNHQYVTAILSDGSGGAIIVWYDMRNGADYDVYAQRVNSSGVVQWAANGVAISAAAGHQQNPKIVSDGSGGALIAWEDSRSGTQHIYAQRINSSGVAQWAADGVVVSDVAGSQGGLSIISDGSGGAVIAYQDDRGTADWHIYAQRIDPTGTAQWAAGGVSICTAANSQFAPALVSDGGGAIVTWFDRRSGTNYDVYAQKISSGGIVQWAADGVSISTDAGNQVKPAIASDGNGGAIIAWTDETAYDIYAQRINSSGVNQWAVNGIVLVANAQEQNNPAIISDGSGGGIVTWQDMRGAAHFDIYAQRIDASGTAQWAVNGAAVSTSAGNHTYSTIISDGNSGAIITWQDLRGATADIYAQRIYSDGTLLPSYALTVSKDGTGSGTITADSGAVNCGPTCSDIYTSGTVVTLSATPGAGSTFTGWSGDADCSDGVVTMNANVSCTATFTLNTYTLTVTKSGTGAGAISAGANCTLIWVGNIGACTINSGTAITLTGAAADTGSAFTGWTSGAGSAASCAGAGQCSFNLNANTSVTGSFSPTFSQYADIVTGFSSQWASTSWPATQALGAPDTNSYGDYSTAWAPLPKNGSQEYLRLEFASPVYASGAMVRETYGNGFVTQIDAIDLSDALHTVWSGTDNSAPGSPVNFEVSWALTSYLVKGLKIYVNTDHNVNAWEEIDAVRLYGVTAAETNPPAGGVSINGGSGYTPSASVTLTLTCTDAEGGCSDMRFRNENDGWSAPESFSTTKAWTLSAGDGTKTVYAKVKDNAGGWGNWSGALSDTIVLDTVPPTGKVSINSDAAYTSSATVSLKLSASDTNSMDMQFSNDNVNWSVFEPYATTKTWTLSAGDGAKTVYVKFRDSAGNMSGIYNDSINLDSTHTFQYASSVINYSSQYGTSSWSATQTLGEPNTFSYGDVSTSWTPSSQNGTQEYLTLGFTTPVYTDGVVIRETYGNGFVYQVDVVDTNDVLHTVWTGTDTSAPGSPVNFDVSWTQTAYLVKGVKVYVDTDHSGAWEEMDSVQLKGVAASCPPPAGLVSWWKGEGNANDSTGTNNGALTNGNTYSTGKAGQAFSLDGTNDYVAIPKVVDRWAQGTIGVWVKYNNPAPGPNGTYIFSASSNVPLTGSWDGTNLGIHPSYGGNDLRFGIYTSGWQWAASGLVPESGQWYHIVGTWGPAGIKIFINGALKGTNAYNGVSSFANYNIIGASSWPGTVVNGIVDEFQIYDRALDPAEIASLYNSVDTGTCAPALASDITPEAFTFTDQVGVAINTVMTSNTITVAGINAAAPISITGGTYSINGGSYTSAAGTANNGDQVAVRLTTSVNNSSTTNAMLTIGGVSDTFSVTTIPVPTYIITPGAGPNGKITCAPTTVNHGSSSTCTITPEADYQVEDIEVDGVSVGKAATYSMSNITSDCTVTASFSIKKYDLSITKTGSGTVAVSPPGGGCGTDCLTYNKNQRVTVTAKAEKDSIFTGWSGGCSGAGVCTVTMGADTNIAANFVAAAPVISVAPDGPQDFETVRVGRLKTKTLKITNNGTGNLRITSVEIDGTDSDMFSKRSGTAIIKPGKSSNLRVMFKPKSPGLKTATLMINSNDPEHPVIEMPLSGTGKLK